MDIYSLEETLQDKIHLLGVELVNVKADIADLKDHLTSVSKELDVVTGGGIEDELFGVKAGNIEMRNHFNSMIKQLNEITAFVNQKYGYRIIEDFEIIYKFFKFFHSSENCCSEKMLTFS